MKKFRNDLTASSTARQEGLMLKDWCTGFLKLSKNHTFNHYLAKPVKKGNEMKMKIFFTRAKGFSLEKFFLSKVIVIIRD